MKSAKVVIGANYGDEGKGLMTDYFCRTFGDEPVLNIRFNGGAQAGHTVVCEDGKRHVFSHFGSGSFNHNVITCLDSRFILNPILFRREHSVLTSFGVETLPYISGYCGVTLPSDMMINQMVETHRGTDRHGSCGLGIWEIIKRQSDWGTLVLLDFFDKDVEQIVDMLVDSYHVFGRVRSRLRDLNIDDSENKYLYDRNILYSFAHDVIYMIQNSVIYLERGDLIKEYDNFVFEGAQGLQLHEDKGKYTTPSNTGPTNAAGWMIRGPKFDVEVCYVSRSYFTRHGAGPFATECPMEDISTMISADKTNVQNEFQGAFRYGFFDRQLFFSGIKEQNEALATMRQRGRNKVKTAFAFTHLDETGSLILTRSYTMGIRELIEYGNIRYGVAPDVVYGSWGEVAKDVSHLTWM